MSDVDSTDAKLLQEAVVERVKDAIVGYIKRSGGPVLPSELARWLGIKPELVRRFCQELIQEGTLGTKPKESLNAEEVTGVVVLPG